jgi:sugar lactone lactonase YvrE
VAFDPQGNLLIAEIYRIRKVDATSGYITTIVGGGPYGFCGDSIKATDACFAYITGFAVDSKGNVYINDYYNVRVSRFDPATNILTTIGGNGTPGFSGDSGDARSATISGPYGLAVDETRRALYIADAGNNRVRRIDLDTNVISTVMQDLTAIGLAVDQSGNLFAASGGEVYRRDVGTAQITRFAGGGTPADHVGDGGPAAQAEIGRAWALTIDGSGNLLIGDFGRYRVRRVDAGTQIITTIAGSGSAFPIGDGEPATASTLQDPRGLSIDAAGNLYITDGVNNRIRKVDAVTQVITTVVGGGDPESREENPLATEANLTSPTGRVVIDAVGNLYIAEYMRVSRVDAVTKRVSRFAGTGREDSPRGDGGPALDARVSPRDLAMDGLGNLYIAESNRIRMMNLSSGIIITVAGGGQPGSGNGDGAPATAAVLGEHNDIAVDSAGNLFIADWEGERIRRVGRVNGFITTIAGGGSTKCGIDAPAISVTLLPAAIAVDSAGNIYVADYCWPYGVRKISSTTGRITSLAGGNEPELGDNNSATRGYMYPTAMAVDAAGNLYIADTLNRRVRAVRGPFP